VLIFSKSTAASFFSLSSTPTAAPVNTGNNELIIDPIPPPKAKALIPMKMKVNSKIIKNRSPMNNFTSAL